MQDAWFLLVWKLNCCSLPIPASALKASFYSLIRDTIGAKLVPAFCWSNHHYTRALDTPPATHFIPIRLTARLGRLEVLLQLGMQCILSLGRKTEQVSRVLWECHLWTAWTLQNRRIVRRLGWWPRRVPLSASE